MSDITIAIWVVAFGVGLLAAIPYGIWMIATATRKRWRKLGVLVAFPAAIFIVLLVTTGIFERADRRAYLAAIYSAEVRYGAPIFEYHSRRSFNGDGYSIEIYALPESVRDTFESADESLFATFPIRPDYRGDWDTEHWREAPLDKAFDDYLSFALSAYDSGRAPGLAKHFEDIEAALKRRGTFYSFFKYDHGSHPGNIDMFIVDLVRGRVYEINHNT